MISQCLFILFRFEQKYERCSARIRKWRPARLIQHGRGKNAISVTTRLGYFCRFLENKFSYKSIPNKNEVTFWAYLKALLLK